MRKDSILIFGISVLITAAIIGGAYYMTIVRPVPEQVLQTRPEAIPADPQPTGNLTFKEPTGTVWTDKPIKCFDKKVGEYWTNASNCEGADLGNRISNAEPLQRVNGKSRATAVAGSKKAPSKRAKQKQKPSLRLMAKSPPSGLNVPCKFAVGKALEIERALSAASDPGKSIWLEDYCRWHGEIRQEKCEVPGDLFYYGHLCAYRG